jgi:hypothetical protein
VLRSAERVTPRRLVSLARFNPLRFLVVKGHPGREMEAFHA